MSFKAESDWVMLAPYNDVSLLRDAFAFEMWREMGHWAPRTRMVEMILNGKYVGVYVLCEKIKRGTNRVNINRLKESDIAGRDLTGGYILRIDAVDEEDATFTSKVEGVGGGFMGSHVSWACIYPKKSKLKKEQFDYIHQFIDDMELTIQSDSFTDDSRFSIATKMAYASAPFALQAVVPVVFVSMWMGIAVPLSPTSRF